MTVTNVVRWLVVALLTGHGVIHLLGVAKAFGWARVPQLEHPTGAWSGVVWLLAALLVLASAAFVAAGAPTWWWIIAACGAAVSQTAIVTSWSDAKVGTVLNVVLALAAAYGFASLGPWSFDAQWQDRAANAVADSERTTSLVTEADLSDLPKPLAAYVRRSGAVGKPRVANFYADIHGRIRAGAEEAWMPFTGRQVNTYGPNPTRVFLIDATRSGLPVTVLHVFGDSTATMRAKALSMVTVVDASGPAMTRGGTVTVFNDLVVLAPGAIPDAPVIWTGVDAHHVRGVLTDGDETVSAELTFDTDHDLVNFVSEDRMRASPDGESFTQERWSTPLTEHRDTNGHRILAVGGGSLGRPRTGGSFHLRRVPPRRHHLQRPARHPAGPVIRLCSGYRRRRPLSRNPAVIDRCATRRATQTTSSKEPSRCGSTRSS